MQTIYDKTDVLILLALAKEARLTHQEIGRAVGLSAPAVYQRIKRLERDGLVLGYHARLNLERLGRPYEVVLRVEVTGPSDAAALVRRWEATPAIEECRRLSDAHLYELRLRLRAPDELAGHLDAFAKEGCRVRAHFVLATLFTRQAPPVPTPP